MRNTLLYLLIFALLIRPASAQDTPYLVLRSLYDFDYLSTAPFETCGAMKWDEDKGFSEITSTPQYLYTFVDFDYERHGYVLQDVDSERRFVFFMEKELGSDGMPHVSEMYWLCDDETS